MSNHRAEAAGNRPIPGDEHTVPLLVVFPARSLQQEDVRGVQTAGGRGREGRIQVRTCDGSWLHSHMLVCISASFNSISHLSILFSGAQFALIVYLNIFVCVSQVWFRVPVQVLQLRSGEEVQARHLQGLPGGDHERLRSW